MASLSWLVLDVTRLHAQRALWGVLRKDWRNLVPPASSLSLSSRCKRRATWAILTRFDLGRKAESLLHRETRTRHL
jgi:hypothetical protein